MDKRHSAVFGRHFSFIGVFAILILCLVFLGACDSKDVSGLFTPSSEFQVTFVLNNGEDNIVWHRGDVVPSPTKENYKFVGWCNDAALNSLTNPDFESLSLSQNLVLYAKWEELPDITGVIFEDVNVVYDGQEHILEVQNLPSGATVVYDVENSYTNVGKYTINALVSLEGYKDLSLSATLTIEKAVVSGISFEDKEVDWDGGVHAIEVEGNLPSGVSVEYFGNKQSEVGQYKVVARFSVSDNYEPIEDMSATLTINEVYFLVSFVNGNGNIYAESVAHGCGVRRIPELYQKDGYTASWQKIDTTSVYKDLTINAEYTPITYTISFVSAGDVVNEIEYNIEKGVDFATWQRDCYTFDGWYTDALCTSKRIDGIGAGNIGDKTYYAKWIPVEYTVRYHLNGGLNSKQNVNSGEEYIYTVESSRLVLEDPSKSHYVFEGWFANANFTGMKWEYLPKGASGNRDFYAKWTPETYSVEYRLGGGINSEENPSGYNYESSCITLLPATREHYDFVCWCNEKNEVVTTLADGKYGDVVLIARWKAIEHTIYLCEDNGTIFDKIIYTIESEDIKLEKQLKPYYDFVGWYDKSGNKVETISAKTAEDVYVYTKFTPKDFSIIYAYNGGNVVNNPTTYTIEDEDITLIDSSRDYYAFLGWYNGEEKVEKITKGSHGIIKLDAKWQAVEYTVYLCDEEGVSFDEITYTVESDDIVLSNQLKEYYDFVGWFDEDGNKITTIPASTAKDLCVYTKFSPKEYAIKYLYTGGVGDNVTTYTVESDDIYLKEPYREHYTFLGWYNGNEKVEIIKKGSHGNIELHARWKAIEYSVSYHGVENTSGYVRKYSVESNNFVLPSPNKDYYIFDGWFDNQDFIGSEITQIDTQNPQNYSLYAKFTPIKYHISYNLNGGSEVQNPTSYTVEDDEITLIKPIKDNYVFLGWYSDSEKVVKINKGSHEDFALVAKWKAVEYTVYLCDEEGACFDRIIYTIESDDIVLANQLKEYYDFVGWFDEDGNKIATISASTAKDVYVYTKFKAKEFAIKYAYNGGEDANNPTTYTIEDEDITLIDSSRDYYTFLGWYKGSEKVEVIAKGSHGSITLEAKWQANEYSIAYHDVEDTTKYITSFTVESENIVLPIPHKDYYNFAGWYTSQDFGTKIVEIDAKNPQNYNLYAKFTAIEYRISYELNGGSNVQNPTSYTVEDSEITLIEPTKDNYVFLGWYNGNEKVERIFKGAHENITLEAKWKAIEYTVYLCDENGLIFDKIIYTVESNDIELENQLKEYYDFVGWFDKDDNKIATIPANTAKDVYVYTKFKAKVYTITYAYNGGGDVDNPTTYTIEDEDITLIEPSRDYYTFLGWYSGSEKVERIAKGSHGAITLEAKWQAVEYSITYHGVEDTSDYVKSYTVESENITLPVLDRDYYTFDGWYASSNFDGKAISEINTSNPQNYNLYAKFTAIEYHISYDYNGGSVVDNPTSYTVEDNNIQLLNPTRKHYNFMGWFNGSEKVEIINTNSPIDITLRAKWQAVEYIIAYYGVDNTVGYVTSYTVESENITLPIPHKDYYDFGGWYLSQDFSNNAIVEIDTSNPQNYSLYAKFTAIEYHISYNYNGGSEVNNPKVYTFESDTITLLAPIKDNYTFVGWYNQDTRIQSIAKGSHGDLSLEARWSSDVHTITYCNVDDTSDYPKTYSIESGDVTLPTPIKNYYNFIGWYENADFSGEKVAVIKANDTKDYVLYPRFAPIEYAISYSYNGGLDAQNPTRYTVESDRILLKETSKVHYNFVGWYSGDGKVEIIESGSHGNMCLEARFEAIEYSITYHNVENIASFVATYTIEDGDIILQKPQKDYYDFVGWYLSADFSGDAVEKLNVSENGNAVVYALFTPISYSITYDLSSGVSNSNKTSYTVEDSDFALLDVEKRGYNFIGWYDSQTNEKVEVVTTSNASNRRFYAKFSAIEYTITYEGASGLANDNRVSYTVEDSDFALLDVEKRGYNFIGWYDSQTNEKVEVVTTADARNYRLYAKFSAIEYSITYEGASGLANDNRVSYTVEDSDFTLSNVTQDGFEFLGWYDSETDEKVSIIDTSLAKNITLVAKWNKLPSSTQSTPFVVNENGCLTGIDASLLDDKTVINVPSSVDGVSVNSIGSGAFASIKDTATQIEIAEGIEEIASNLFSGMSKLEKLVLPSTITTMYKGMLADCVALRDVTVPFASFWTSEIGGTSATKYSKGMSNGYAYNFMYLFGVPENKDNYSAVSIQYETLDTSSLVYVEKRYIPNTLTQVTVHGGDVSAKAFCEINTLESITLGSEVSYIGNMAFAKNSGIKEIVIEGSVVTFGTTVFSKSDNLTTIYVANTDVKTKVDALISGSTQCKLISEK